MQDSPGYINKLTTQSYLPCGGVGTTECGRHQKRIRFITATLQYVIDLTRMTIGDDITNGMFFC